MILNSIKKIKKFWLSDTSFISLLIVLLFLNFIVPVLIDAEIIGEYSLNAIYLFLFLVGIFSSDHLWFKVLTISFFLLQVILRFIRFSDSDTEFYLGTSRDVDEPHFTDYCQFKITFQK
jgi:hypothetical membrane protein